MNFLRPHEPPLLPFVAWALIFASGCQPENVFVPPPPPQVTVAQPVEQMVSDALEFTGWTEATATVEIRARVTGYLHDAPFEDGARVNEGDLLFVIEQEPFETARDLAAAEVQKSEAALLLARTEYDRAKPLVERAAISQSELDIRAAELATAKATLASTKASLRQAELNFAYTEIRAPVSGIIGRRLVDPGNLVAAGETKLARIEQIDPLYAYFSVSETDLLRALQSLREAKMTPEDLEKVPPKIYLGLANETGFPREGVLDFSERSIDRQTGTAMRRGVFDNANQELIPGMFVRIRSPLGEPRQRLLVEERAVSADQRGNYLMVVSENNTVEYRPVRLGIAHEGMRVVEEGVQKSDWIIVNGLQRARPGAEVNPQRVSEVNRDETAAAPSKPPKSS